MFELDVDVARIAVIVRGVGERLDLGWVSCNI